MAKAEDVFRKNVMAACERLGFHVTHIESHDASPGVPDLNIWDRRSDVWLELKVAKDGSAKLRPTQKRWHRERHLRMGDSFVAVLCDDGVLTVPGPVAAERGDKVSELRKCAVNYPTIDLIMKECGYGKAKPDR